MALPLVRALKSLSGLARLALPDYEFPGRHDAPPCEASIAAIAALPNVTHLDVSFVQLRQDQVAPQNRIPATRGP